MDGADGVGGAQYMNCATFGGGKGANNARFNASGVIHARLNITAGTEIFAGYKGDYWNKHGHSN